MFLNTSSMAYDSTCNYIVVLKDFDNTEILINKSAIAYIETDNRVIHFTNGGTITVSSKMDVYEWRLTCEHF